MDYETKILLDNLIDAVNGTNHTDWWMFSVSVAGVLASLVVSFMLWRTTKKIGERQNVLQYHSIKMQMYEKYFTLYKAVQSDVDKVQRVYEQWAHLLMRPTSELMEYSNSIRGVLPIARQLLPQKEYQELTRLEQLCETYMRDVYLINLYIQDLDLSTRERLLSILFECQKSPNIEAFIIEYQKLSGERGTSQLLLARRKEFLEFLENGFIDKIRAYSDLSTLLY